MPALSGRELKGSKQQWIDVERVDQPGVMTSLFVDIDYVQSACNAWNLLRWQGKLGLHDDSLFCFMERKGKLVVRTWRVDADNVPIEVKDHDPRDLIVGAGPFRLVLGVGE